MIIERNIIVVHLNNKINIFLKYKIKIMHMFNKCNFNFFCKSNLVFNISCNDR
jgi:hypothetical protein